MDRKKKRRWRIEKWKNKIEEAHVHFFLLKKRKMCVHCNATKTKIKSNYQKKNGGGEERKRKRKKREADKKERENTDGPPPSDPTATAQPRPGNKKRKRRAHAGPTLPLPSPTHITLISLVVRSPSPRACVRMNRPPFLPFLSLYNSSPSLSLSMAAAHGAMIPSPGGPPALPALLP